MCVGMVMHIVNAIRFQFWNMSICLLAYSSQWFQNWFVAHCIHASKSLIHESICSYSIKQSQPNGKKVEIKIIPMKIWEWCSLEAWTLNTEYGIQSVVTTNWFMNYSTNLNNSLLKGMCKLHIEMVVLCLRRMAHKMIWLIFGVRWNTQIE